MNPTHLIRERAGHDEWLSRHHFPPVVEHRTDWLTKLMDWWQTRRQEPKQTWRQER